jgi:hypothetical protein
MAQQPEEGQAGDSQAPVPAGQRYFDRIFLLLAVSILISALVYNAWGVIELLTLPPLP